MKVSKTEYISYDEIIDQCKAKGIDVTWRKLNYYKTLGLLPNAIKQEGDKRGYYPESTVFVLSIYHFLQNNLNMTLDEIKNMINQYKKQASVYPDTFRLLAQWIHDTYGQFLPMVVEEIKRRGDLPFGAATMSHIDWFYKSQFIKTGNKFFNKIGEGLKGGGELEGQAKVFDKRWHECAKEWADQAVGVVMQALESVRPTKK